jgi:hypothetical protein
MCCQIVLAKRVLFDFSCEFDDSCAKKSNVKSIALQKNQKTETDNLLFVCRAMSDSHCKNSVVLLPLQKQRCPIAIVNKGYAITLTKTFGKFFQNPNGLSDNCCKI